MWSIVCLHGLKCILRSRYPDAISWAHYKALKPDLDNYLNMKHLTTESTAHASSDCTCINSNNFESISKSDRVLILTPWTWGGCHMTSSRREWWRHKWVMTSSTVRISTKITTWIHSNPGKIVFQRRCYSYQRTFSIHEYGVWLEIGCKRRFWSQQLPGPLYEINRPWIRGWCIHVMILAETLTVDDVITHLWRHCSRFDDVIWPSSTWYDLI